MSPPAWALAAGIGLSPIELPPADHPGNFDAPPVLMWESPLPGPRFPAATHTELGGPVLVDGYILVGAAASDALMVLDRSDGRLVRRLPADGPVQSAALVLDGDGGHRVLFSDSAGSTHLYDLDDGTRLWRHQGGSPVLGTPLVYDGTVFVTGVDDVVTALALDDGAFRWRHAQKIERVLRAGPALYGAPTMVPVTTDTGTVMLAGFSDGTLVALTPDRGEVQWQRRVGEGAYPDLIGAPLVADGDNVIVGGFSGPLLSLDPDDRAVRWRVEVGSAAAPAVGPIEGASGLPTLFHGGVDGKLRAIDARTSEVRWTWDSETQGALTRPVYTDAGLLVGSSAGGLYLVDPVLGHELWQLEPGYLLAGVSAPPAVDGRQAVIVTNAGRVLSLVVPPHPERSGDGFFDRVGGPQATAPAGTPISLGASR